MQHELHHAGLSFPCEKRRAKFIMQCCQASNRFPPILNPTLISNMFFPGPSPILNLLENEGGVAGFRAQGSEGLAWASDVRF